MHEFLQPHKGWISQAPSRLKRSPSLLTDRLILHEGVSGLLSGRAVRLHQIEHLNNYAITHDIKHDIKHALKYATKNAIIDR